MKTIFLTDSKTDKDEFKKISLEVSEVIADAFSDDRAYSGPTPQELKEIIRQDTILPEEGLGWEKTFELARKKSFRISLGLHQRITWLTFTVLPLLKLLQQNRSFLLSTSQWTAVTSLRLQRKLKLK
nr:hypothetical protein [uncultured Treponema sp.]